MKKKYNDEVYNFVSRHVKGRTTQELVQLTNDAMGTDFTITKMQSYKRNHNLKSGIRYNGRKGSKLFPLEIIKFIRENAPGRYNKELTELVNKTFKTNYKVNQIEHFKVNNKISSGLTGQFEKGHIPANKGKKMSASQYEKCSKTMFKKGHIPHNYRPIGSERADTKDGYISVKIADPNEWKLKHILIYEQHHGPVPEGHKVVFLDKNRRNFNIENLVLVSDAEMVRLNQNHRISEYPEITKMGIALERSKIAVRKRIKDAKPPQ